MQYFDAETDGLERTGKVIGELVAAFIIVAVVIIYGHSLFFR
ncbi:MAG TPA: hypothetical protein VGF53_01760 [Pseudolabrys sp.]